MSRWYDLAGGDGHPVGLTEARNLSWKPHALQIIDDIRNQLSDVHTYLCWDDTDQPIPSQGEIDIAIAGQNVAK